MKKIYFVDFYFHDADIPYRTTICNSLAEVRELKRLYRYSGNRLVVTS